MRHVAASRIGVSAVFTAALLVAALVFAGSGGATFPGRNGRIVFADARTDQPGEGNSQIYRLDLASGHSRNLAPSTAYDDREIALSRDGTQIAFVRAAFSGFPEVGQLWSMRRDGSAPRRLVASIEDPYDLAWSPDGTKIAFLATSPPAGTSSLWVVDADGGGLRQLTTFWTQDPRWSPDGSVIAFAGREGAAVQEALHVGIVGASGSGVRWLTPTPAASDHLHSESAPSWSPDGKALAFVQGNTLVLIEVDGSGERTLTAGPVNTGLNTGSQWSPRGDEIGFVDADHKLELIHPDGTGLRTLAGDVGAYVWSPGGDRLVYVQSVPNSVRDVLVVKPLSGPGRFFRLPSIGVGPTGGPAWSPNGKNLFYSDVKARQDFELYSIGPRGGGLKQLARNSVDDFDPASSPDGRRIAFARGNSADGPSSLYLMDADGRHVRRLTRAAGMDTSPSWAPDNTHLVFARGISPKVAYPEIDTLDTRTGHVQRLASAWVAAEDGPAWSPDGRLIAYNLHAGRHNKLVVVHPDGRHALTLYNEGADAYTPRPSWSPDGRSIAFALGGSELVISRRGGTARPLSCTFPDGVERKLGRVSWSPDGTALAVEHADAIWVCPLNGSRPDRPAAASEPDWQPLR